VREVVAQREEAWYSGRVRFLQVLLEVAAAEEDERGRG